MIEFVDNFCSDEYTEIETVMEITGLTYEEITKNRIPQDYDNGYDMVRVWARK